MENPPKPTETNSIPSTQEQAKPVKEKKPRSEAQQAATAKALAAMTAARKQRAEKQIAKKEEIKKAKKVIEEKIMKEDIGFATKSDVDNRISALTKELAEVRALYAVAKEREVEKPKERIVERVIERQPPTPQVQQPVKLSGHALLDSIFFNK
jgi:hypothetical protein